MTHHQLRLAANKLLKIIIACTLLAALSANANPVRIAVASNFKQTLEAILPAFEQAYPKTEVQVISGSTGGLYAQIMNGAPFDLFLAFSNILIQLIFLPFQITEFLYELFQYFLFNIWIIHSGAIGHPLCHKSKWDR